MKRRTMIQSGIGGLAAAFSASAFASTKLKGNEKMMPVDTLNHEPGWDKEPVEVLEIKGVRIGEGRPKIIASTTAKTPEAFIALVKDYNSRPELQMIELRPDYIGEISGKEFAKSLSRSRNRQEQTDSHDLPRQDRRRRQTRFRRILQRLLF